MIGKEEDDIERPRIWAQSWELWHVSLEEET